VCGALAFGLASCSKEEPSSDPPGTRLASTTTSTTKPPVTTSTVPVLSPDQVAKLSDYDQIAYVVNSYQREFYLLGQQPDLNRNSFFSLLTDDALEFQTNAIADDISNGRAWRLPENSRYSDRILQIASVGDVGTALECVVDDTVVYQVADGKVVNDKVTTILIEDTLVKRAGRWQISVSRSLKQSDGEQPCEMP